MIQLLKKKNKWLRLDWYSHQNKQKIKLEFGFQKIQPLNGVANGKLHSLEKYL